MSRRFRWLPQARWKRWLLLSVLVFLFLGLMLVSLIITAVLLWQNPKVQSWVMIQVLHHQSHQPAEPPPFARLSDEERRLLKTNAAELRDASQLFEPTNVWDVQLRFTSNQWAKLGPNIVPPIVHFLQPDGSVILRNPAAIRNGLAGVFGLDFPWSQGALQFGDRTFATVQARFKGNGTFVGSQRSYKRPFKIEMDPGPDTDGLAGRSTLNFHNLTADASCLSDMLGYEFYRKAGVPASRTAFARVRLTISEKFEDRLLGLYVLVENPDREWARERFNQSGVVLFKPVTYELFKDLGDDWKAYAGIYDAKGKVKPGQTGRVIGFAKLFTHANDTEFEQHVGEYIDLDEFARFIACEVILSNYDGILNDGQNFLMYLDPQTGRFGFIPWDLDQCWGEFPFTGTIAQREQASITHPWIGENRFLQRMLACRPVKQRYRSELQRIRNQLFQPDQLNRRLDEMIRIVRPFVAEESPKRLARFDRQISDHFSTATNGPGSATGNANAFRFRRFFSVRAASVSDQLAGRTEGVIIHRK
jgi:spore coat protein H